MSSKVSVVFSEPTSVTVSGSGMEDAALLLHLEHAH